jgi:hypothetical protein
VVCPDLYRVASSFKVMSPLFEPSDDGEHLGIMDLIISLYRVECFRQEGNWVPGIVITRLLGENCSSSDARAVCFESEWETTIREHQYGSRSDELLELYEGVFLG